MGIWALLAPTGVSRLVFGGTELSQVCLWLVIRRHLAPCERVIDDPSLSRHLRMGITAGKRYIEGRSELADGAPLDGEELPQFEPMSLAAGQERTVDRVVLEEAHTEAP